jgi:hypothetical protein
LIMASNCTVNPHNKGTTENRKVISITTYVVTTLSQSNTFNTKSP